jgi:hypothetical protein
LTTATPAIFAPEMKFAATRSSSMKRAGAVVLWIKDEKVEFVPAAENYWGLRSRHEDLLRGDLDENLKFFHWSRGRESYPLGSLSTDQFHKAGWEVTALSSAPRTQAVATGALVR